MPLPTEEPVNDGNGVANRNLLEDCKFADCGCAADPRGRAEARCNSPLIISKETCAVSSQATLIRL